MDSLPFRCGAQVARKIAARWPPRPMPASGHIFDVQLAMLDALSGADQRLCVDFLYGGASEAFYQFSARNRQLASDMAIAGLDAIVDGEAKKNKRRSAE